MQLKVEKVQDVAVVTLDQDYLDAGNSTEFKKQLKEVDGSANKIVLDLAKVSFVDSSGLGAILSGLRRATQAGGGLKICGVSQSVKVLFELIGMHKIVQIFDNRDKAVESFQI